MDIYARLKRDHQLHRALATQLEATSGDSPDRRRLWVEFRQEVEAHANAEEQSFYAELIECPDGQEKARHSIAEHKESSDLIEEIDGLDMSSPAWLQTFKKLKDELEHHMDEEEEEVFPLAHRLLDAAIAHELTARFEKRKSDECA